MPILPPGFAQISLGFERSGDPELMYNVWGVDLNDLPPEEYGDVLAAFGNAFMDACDQAIDDSIVLRNIKALFGNDGDPQSFEIPFNRAGTDSYAIVPQNTSILVKKITTRAGRKGRGRAYLPWCQETAVSDAGVLTSGYVSDWQTNMDNFVGNLDLLSTGLSVDLSLVLLHSGQGPGSNTPDAVVGLIVESMVATQRRRLRR